MSDENKTAEQPDARPFEERLFARLDSMDARLTRLEEAAEQRIMQTRPIWERALAEIAETRQEMHHRFRQLELVLTPRLDRIESLASTTRGEMLSLRASFNELRGELQENLVIPMTAK